MTRFAVNAPQQIVRKGKIGNDQTRGNQGADKTGLPAFDQVLQDKLEATATDGVKFSKHAMQRIESRNIQMDDSEKQKVDDAVKKAKEKGSRESLFIGANYALIVNIKNNTVVTAMDKEQMSENVVTNIDSTVIL